MERRRGDFEGRADEAIEAALRRLRIPTHTEIERINVRLDRISAQIKKLGASEPVKSPGRKRKAAR